MKKDYVAPIVLNVEMVSETLIAASIAIDKNSSGEEQLTNKQQGNWGNLWKAE